MDDLAALDKCISNALNDTEPRGVSRTAATSKVELIVIIVNGWKPLTIITKSSTLHAAAVLDTSLEPNARSKLDNLHRDNLNGIIFPHLNINLIRNKFDQLADLIKEKFDVLVRAHLGLLQHPRWSAL